MLCRSFLAWDTRADHAATEAMCLLERNNIFYAGDEVEMTRLSRYPGEAGCIAIDVTASARTTSGVSTADPGTFFPGTGSASTIIPGSLCYLDGTSSSRHLLYAATVQVENGGYRICCLFDDWKLGDC